jgi:hypothetical protein
MNRCSVAQLCLSSMRRKVSCRERRVKVTDTTGSRPLGTAFHSSHHHTERGSEHVYLPGNCETTSDVIGTLIAGQQVVLFFLWD